MKDETRKFYSSVFSASSIFPTVHSVTLRCDALGRVWAAFLGGPGCMQNCSQYNRVFVATMSRE